MNSKYVFIFFITIILILTLFYLYSPYKIESFSDNCATQSQLEEIQNTILQQAQNATADTSDAMINNMNQQKLGTTTTTEDNISIIQFIIYEDRIYGISNTNKLYCRYINGGKWFILYSNYDQISSILKDIFVIRYNNDLIIYALFNNLVYKKLVDNYKKDWEVLDGLKGLRNIKEITGNNEYLLLYSPKIDDTDNSEEGVFRLKYSDSSLEPINDNSKFTSIRTNVYRQDNVWYSLYNQSNTNIFTIKSKYEDDLEYNDSFEFDITFKDLFVTNDFIYGYGKDKYIYRKSIVSDLSGKEMSTWSKVSSKINITSVDRNNGGKKLSIYNGYIYCLISNEIKKHKIQGYKWLDINDVEYEKQFYKEDPQKVLDNIHSNLNIDNTILPDKLNLYI